MAQSNRKTASEIIDMFGGTNAVAGLLSVNKSTVSMWRARDSIPGKWQLRLLRLASEQGVSLSLEELEKSMPPTKRSAA